MSDNRKYYYLKLKDNFFDTDEMIVLESMPDGHMYSNILLKLYLRSLKYEGRLMFNDRIPYNPTILAQITRHNVGVMEKALKTFSDLGLVEMLDTGVMYMADIQNFIGESSTEADRKRAYRNKIENEKKLTIGQMSDKCPDKSPPELELELEKDIEKEKENNIVASKEATTFEQDSFEMKVVDALILKIRELRPTFKEPNKETWAKEVDRMIRLDKRTQQEIVEVLQFATNDPFWQTNILSTAKLRKQFDRLAIQASKSNKGEVNMDWNID